MEKKKKPMVRVFVSDFKSKVLSNAKVTLKPLSRKKGKFISLKFNKKMQTYLVPDVPQGQYLLQVEAEGLEPDQREIQVKYNGLKDIFILGKKGMPFYYQGRVRTPFEPPKDLLGVSLKPGLTNKEEEELLKAARRLKLDSAEVSDSVRLDNVRVFKFTSGTSEKNKRETLKKLSEHPMVRLAGPVLKISEEGVSFLTRQLIVRFKPDVTEKEFLEIAKSHNLSVVRKVSYSRNTVLLESSDLPGYDLLKICDELVKSKRVEYAQPNRVMTATDTQVLPTDFMYPEQWHLPRINMPEAWQALRNANPPGVNPGDPGDRTFGSENIIIAVLDRGIQSQTVGGVTSAAHPDFDGVVTSGADKVCLFYDFDNMVPNNNAPGSNHGMGCAGVATALANNPSVIAGTEEGVVGSAPNCLLMGLMRPVGATEQQYADAFIWVAGFNPGWVIDGVNYFPGTVFPAVPAPGADVISNSFVVFGVLPLIEDALDYIATYGRGGKGVLITFASGNANMNVFAYAPMVCHEKVITVGASSIDDDGVTEIRATYSNFGMEVDVCAPSHDEYLSVLNPRLKIHNPPTNYSVFSCDLLGNGNISGHPAFQTNLTAAAPPAPFTSLTADIGGGATTLNVVSNAGFAINQRVLIGYHGRCDFVRVTAIPAGGTQLTVTVVPRLYRANTPVIGITTINVNNSAGFMPGQWLFFDQPGQPGAEAALIRVVPGGNTIEIAGPINNHALNTQVTFGPQNYRNSFGGTSSASPLTAGVGALMLSANPELTWVEVRQILQDTAVQIDLANVDPVGQWIDTDGDGAPDFSQWYGNGRINAQAAVQEALAYAFDKDIFIRDHLLDAGGVPFVGDPSNSPDIWVRNTDPAVDGALALPATYNDAPPHEDPIVGQDNWIYVRFRNNGAADSFEFYVRIYITHFPGAAFVYPDDFFPSNPPIGPVPVPLEFGTYLIEEVHYDSLAAGADDIISVLLPPEFIPPKSVMVGGVSVPWVPCLLVEISPHDGPTPPGPNVWDNNNLAQKLIDIVDITAPLVEISDNTDNPLPLTVPVPAGVAFSDVLFKIRITDSGFINAESVSFTVTLTARDDTVTVINYAHDAGAWVTAVLPPITINFAPPVNGAGDAVSENVQEAIFNGNMELTGAFKEVLLQVHAQDLSGNTTPLFESSHLLKIAIPTDIALILDYSGSMLFEDDAGHTKWDSAKEAANLFNTVYGALSSLALEDRIALIRFFTETYSGPDLTEVTEDLAPVDPDTELVIDQPPPLSDLHWTPMGTGVVTGHGELAPPAPDWRNRVMILLTDGKENRPPLLEVVRSAPAGDPNYVPNLTEDSQVGYRIYACAFGPPGEVDTDAIQGLAIGGDGLKSYNGQLHSTETTEDPNAAYALKEQFIFLLADSLTAEVIGPFDSEFTIEPGVSEMVCLVTTNVGFTVTPPPAHVGPIGGITATPGFSWVRILNPAPGMWTLGGFAASDTVKGFAIVDLTLNSKFDAARTGLGVGLPLPLIAEIKEKGMGVSGANVEVTVEGPDESIGEIIMDHTSKPGFDINKWKKKILEPDKGDSIGIRRDLLIDIQKSRRTGLRKFSNRITLHETAHSGRYEGMWLKTLAEGTYTFRFKATGMTHSGMPFERDYILSRYLPPVPDAERTTVDWVYVIERTKRVVKWSIKVFPVTAVGRPMGPGLGARISLILYYGSKTDKRRKKLSLKVTDELNGSYTAKFELPIKEQPTGLVLCMDNMTVPIKVSPKQFRTGKISSKKVIKRKKEKAKKKKKTKKRKIKIRFKKRPKKKIKKKSKKKTKRKTKIKLRRRLKRKSKKIKRRKR